MLGTRKQKNKYDIPNKTSKKRLEKYGVYRKTHGVRKKGIAIRGKANGKSGGVSSLIMPSYTQGKTFGIFILWDIIVTVYNNQGVINAIDAFNDGDNSFFKNLIHVIMNVKVLTSEIFLDKPMHNVTTHFEPKGIGYNINVFKDLIEDVSEDCNDDVKQDVSCNMSGMLETKSPTHKDDEKVSPDNPEMNDLVNSVSDNIDDVVNDFVSAYEVSIS